MGFRRADILGFKDPYRFVAPPVTMTGLTAGWTNPATGLTPVGYSLTIFEISSTANAPSATRDHVKRICTVDGVAKGEAGAAMTNDMSPSCPVEGFVCGKWYRTYLRAFNKFGGFQENSVAFQAVIPYCAAPPTPTPSPIPPATGPTPVPPTPAPRPPPGADGLPTVLTATIAGGDRSVGRDASFVVDGSPSYNPSCSKTATYEYQWRLVPKGEPFDGASTVLFETAFGADKKTVPLATSTAPAPAPAIPNFAFGKSYTLYLRVNSTCPGAGWAEDTTSITINVLDKVLPVVKIDTETSSLKDPTKLTDSKTLTMRCRSRVDPDPSWPSVAVMSWVAPNKEPELAEILTYLNAGANKAENFMVFSPEKRPKLVYDKLYLLRCVASYPNAPQDEVVFDEIRVRLIGPPKPGKCSVTPANGILLQDTFTVTAEGWTVSDNDTLPLSYTLKRNGLPVAPTQYSGSFAELSFPVGQVPLVITICDKERSCADCQTSATVASPPAGSACDLYRKRKADLDAKLAAGAITKKQYDQSILQAVSAVTSQLLEEDAANPGKSECAKALSDALLRDTCAATKDMNGTSYAEAAPAIGTIRAFSRLVANYSAEQLLYGCYPDFDPCSIPADRFAEMLGGAAATMSSAIASDSWTPSTATGLDATAGKGTSSPLKDVLSNLIKARSGCVERTSVLKF
eukprot:tig00021532_g22186.t1